MWWVRRRARWGIFREGRVGYWEGGLEYCYCRVALRQGCFSAPGRQAEMLPQREHNPPSHPQRSSKAVDNKAVHAEAIFVSLRIRASEESMFAINVTRPV